MPVPTELPTEAATSPIEAPQTEAPTVEIETASLGETVPVLGTSALGSSLASSALASPSMLPVPTEMPTSPTETPQEMTDEVASGTGVPTVMSGRPHTMEAPDEIPIPFGSSVAMGSSAAWSSSIPSPSEMPVPTELPSPMSPEVMEAVTRDTRTLGVPTRSGGERTLQEDTEIPIPPMQKPGRTGAVHPVAGANGVAHKSFGTTTTRCRCGRAESAARS
eukprot:symbB.v1.2.016166.t1/scaffold1226.1/size132380/2